MTTFSQVVEGALGVRRLTADPVGSMTKDEGIAGSIIQQQAPPQDDDNYLVAAGGLVKTLGPVDYFSSIPIPAPSIAPADIASTTLTPRWTNTIAGGRTVVRHKMTALSTWNTEIWTGVDATSQVLSGLFTDTFYDVQILHWKNGIRSGYSGTVSAKTAVPYTPMSLLVTDGPDPLTTVRFYWNPSAGPIQFWEVQRASNSSFTVGVVTYNGNVPDPQPVQIGPLPSATPFWYRVQLPGSGMGYEATVEHCTAPPAPINLVQNGGGSTAITMNWQNGIVNAWTATDLERAPDPSGPWSFVAQSSRGSGAVSTTDVNAVVPGTLYWYRAYHNSGASVNSYRRGTVSNTTTGRSQPATPNIFSLTGYPGGVEVSYGVTSNAPIEIHVTTDGTWNSGSIVYRFPPEQLGFRRKFLALAPGSWHVRLRHVQYNQFSPLTSTGWSAHALSIGNALTHGVSPLDATNVYAVATGNGGGLTTWRVDLLDSNGSFLTNFVGVGGSGGVVLMSGLTPGTQYRIKTYFVGASSSTGESSFLTNQALPPVLADAVQIKDASGWCFSTLDQSGLVFDVYWTAKHVTYLTHYVTVTRRVGFNSFLVGTDLDPHAPKFTDNLAPLYEDFLTGVATQIFYEVRLYSRSTGILTTLNTPAATLQISTCNPPP